MKKIGVIPNIHKDKDLETTKKLVKWILDHESIPYLNEIIASKIGYTEYGKSSSEIYRECDFIIVLGGDGTILNVARQCAPYSTPILGVNLGHLGFLAEVDNGDIFDAIEKIYIGEYTIDKRMMIEASVVKNDMEIVNFIALNDIVVTRGAFSRMVQLKAFVNEQYLDTYLADGIIISSPTGSTAYSLSAGGPIVYPNVELLVITPICPHTLHSRSIIVSEKDRVKLIIDEGNQDVMITTDGQQGYKLSSSDTIYINKSNKYTNLIRLKNTNFFDLLRNKLSERNINI
ncbi:NAD(+)/NADH kinase [Thermoanaerobacterium sp. RBIITD]|uniref:NAD(+)/NADH kinase n=1 Tax=Thermoanaerobacterium sp. RBIITD TaxID=1550240 RepID=UPI000BB719FA|nr:NAD(+)/NADH kinase [Thermoanaerobacterium sp. RBIITD]SNX55375.1 NAD+ kinase [Thermoanaerobacterium sp. RBIITD]